MKPQSTTADSPARCEIQCPKCRAPMELITFEGITIDRCSTCKGMWFDANEQKLLKQANASDAVDIGDPAVGRKMDKITNIECPRCHVPMIRMVQVDQHATDYEACPNCYGIFLDAGEFRDLKDTTMSEYLAALLEPYKKKA
ncbi:MAG: zf-TFIIB domain-containing protein [Phycisphaerae bacterium]